MDKVILDKDTKEYKEGWNANLKGISSLANPYTVNPEFEMENGLWSKGFNAAQDAWKKGPEDPQPFIDTFFLSVTKAQALEESQMFLSNYEKPENENHEIYTGGTRDEYLTECLNKLSELNKERKRMLAIFALFTENSKQYVE